MKKIPLIVTIVFLFASFLYGDKQIEQEEELRYLAEKAQGRYEEALDHLVQWTLTLDDPLLIEINIIRVDELMIFPELYDLGIDAFNNIAAIPVLQNNAFLNARLQIFKNRLLMEKGRLNEAKKIIHSQGFLGFKVIGPFNNSNTNAFNEMEIDVYNPTKKREYQGKVYRIGWFDVTCDNEGKINFSDLFPNVVNSSFYLYKKINIPEEGEYHLILGKSGYTDIYIDGEKIFSNRIRHLYFPDQYYIKVKLSGGSHEILVKAGDSSGECEISLRLTDSIGKSLSGEHKTVINNSMKPEVQLLSTSIVSPIDRYRNEKNLSDEDIFHYIYISVLCKLTSIDNGMIYSLMDLMDDENSYFPYAAYYASLTENNLAQKEELLTASMTEGNVESLLELIGIKLQYEHLYEAFSLIKNLKGEQRNRIYYSWALGHFFKMKDWDFQLEKIGRTLKEMPYPSLGYEINGELLEEKEQLSNAADEYAYLYEMSNTNLNYARRLILNLQNSGRYEEAGMILLRALVMHPNNISLRLIHARLIEITKGPGKAIPYVTAALKISPYNAETLQFLGTIYHKLNYKKLSLFYFSRALLHDPDNYALKKYMSILKSEETGLENYFYSEEKIEDLLEESEKYDNEGAVIILDETSIAVKPSGSYSKYVRKIIKINKEQAIEDFTNLLIMYDPQIERVDDITCLHRKSGDTLEITDYYIRSLSNPESSLYYDSSVMVIPLSSLAEGSIIDLSYVIHNKSGDEFKNYFSEKVIIGDSNRILKTNLVLSYPDTKKIYYHESMNFKKKISTTRKRNREYIHIEVNNRNPYKYEKSMPHYSEFLPAVYFTSFKSWDELTAWYRSLLDNRIVLNAEMKKAVHSVIGGLKSDEEKIEAIYNYVTKEIHYVGFELGIGAVQPRFSDSTFHSRMGDCKDITVVLIAMLREAGIEAKMALVRTRNQGPMNMDVPYLGEFNHAVCYVDIPGGLFIDGTARFRGYRELPDSIRNIQALVIEDSFSSIEVHKKRSSFEKGFSFIKIDDSGYINNEEIVNTEVLLKPGGNADIFRRLIKKGNTASMARSSLLSKKNKLLSLKQYWNNLYAGVSVSNLNILKTQLNEEVDYSYNVTIPSFMSITENEIIFNSFLTRSNIYNVFAMPGKRIFSLDLGKKQKTIVKTTYTIPEGFEVKILPSNESYEIKGLSAHYSFNSEENKIVIKSEINIQTNRITTEDYNSFRNFSLFVDRKEREYIVLIRK